MTWQYVPRRHSKSPERSPEERARAAAERAARRGEGAPPPETFQGRRAAPPEPAPTDDFRVERTRPPPSPAAEPEPIVDEPEPDGTDGSWFDELSEPERREVEERELAMPDDPFTPDERVAGPQATQEFRPEWDGEEAGALPRRTITATRARPLPPRDPNRPQPRGVRRPPPPRSKPHRPAGAPRGRGGRRVLAVLALALIAGALWLINATFQPFHDDPSGAVRVTVPSGSDAGRIGEILESAGVIDSARLFEANATVTMRRGKLRPGKYLLPLGMSNGAAIEALMQGPQAKVVKTFSFTIPEGRSRRENIPLVNKAAFIGDYGKATTNRALLRRARSLGSPR